MFPGIFQISESLTALKREAGPSGGAGGAGGVHREALHTPVGRAASAAMAPSPTGSSSPSLAAGTVYDVLAVLDAMQAQALEQQTIDAVADAIGHLVCTPLDVLKANGVSAVKTVSVKKGLASVNANDVPTVRLALQRWC